MSHDLDAQHGELEHLYQREVPWITLPSLARVPSVAGIPAEEDCRELLRGIESCRTAASRLVAAAKREIPRQEITEEEVRRAWKRFFLCHFVFFYDLALLADAYRHAITASERGDGQAFDKGLDRACRLWRGAGAFMAYGVDFTPTEEIYKTHIRPYMSEGLSGTWLREYLLVEEQKAAWRRTVGPKRAIPTPMQEANKLLLRAQQTYHKLHYQVMCACVPELISLLQDYQLEHGSLGIEERHLAAYDTWFHVERSPEVSLTEYVRSGCRLFTDCLDDLAAGTGLPDQVLAYLGEAVATMLDMMSERLEVGGPAARA